MAPPDIVPYLGLESHLPVLGVLVPAVYAGAHASTWEAVLFLCTMALCLEVAVEVRAQSTSLRFSVYAETCAFFDRDW